MQSNYVKLICSQVENLQNTTNNVDSNFTFTNREPETQIKYAYFIAGGLMLFNSLTYVILYINGPKSCCIKMDEGETTEEIKMMKENKAFFIGFVVMMFTFYWMYVTLEVAYDNYLTAYVVDELNWIKTAGASLASVYWGTYTLGRIIGIFIVKYISIEILLCSSTALTILSVLPELFFSHSHYSIMWISTVLFGLFISTNYATGLTFANKYVPISGGIESVFAAGSSLGSMTSPVFMVPLFSTCGMQVFVLLFVSSVLEFLVFLGAWMMGRKHGKRSRRLCP